MPLILIHFGTQTIFKIMHSLPAPLAHSYTFVCRESQEALSCDINTQEISVSKEECTSVGAIVPKAGTLSVASVRFMCLFAIIRNANFQHDMRLNVKINQFMSLRMLSCIYATSRSPAAKHR